MSRAGGSNASPAISDLATSLELTKREYTLDGSYEMATCGDARDLQFPTKRSGLRAKEPARRRRVTDHLRMTVVKRKRRWPVAAIGTFAIRTGLT